MAATTRYFYGNSVLKHSKIYCGRQVFMHTLLTLRFFTCVKMINGSTVQSFSLLNFVAQLHYLQLYHVTFMEYFMHEVRQDLRQMCQGLCLTYAFHRITNVATDRVSVWTIAEFSYLLKSHVSNTSH